MKKFITAAIIFILIGMAFIAFNFYATRRAKEQIDKFVQLQVNAPGTLVHIDYSQVNVPLFSGKINFSNVKVQSFEWAVKIDHLQVRLGYFHLFRFFISKTKNALMHTNSADATATKFQFLNSKKQPVFSIDSIILHQKGNLWEAAKTVFLRIPLSQKQLFTLTAAHLQYKKQEAKMGSLKSDSAYIHFVFPRVANTESVKQDSVMISGITWKLPTTLRKNYGMFLAGFGFSPDSLQVARAGFSFSRKGQNRIVIENGTLKTDPLTIAFNGTIIKKRPFVSSEMAPVFLRVMQMSDNLKNLLTGFGFLKPEENQHQDGLSFRLTGPIQSPHLEK